MNGAVRDCSMADVGMDLCVLGVNHVFILQRPGMGCLIGPKTWDRGVRSFGGRMEQPVTAPRLFRGCLGVGWSNLCIKWLYGMHWAGNGRGFRVH